MSHDAHHVAPTIEQRNLAIPAAGVTLTGDLDHSRRTRADW